MFRWGISLEFASPLLPVPSTQFTWLGLENAALRPRAVFSRPRSQFFTIRTSQPANNIYKFLLRISPHLQSSEALLREGVHGCIWQSPQPQNDYLQIITTKLTSNTNQMLMYKFQKESRAFTLELMKNLPTSQTLKKFYCSALNHQPAFKLNWLNYLLET